jgi:hypothetical protein
VEDVSEQYCRDNPTAEICQGDSVGDLQESAVIDVFNTLLDEYNDTDNTTFCDDYFSVTNVDLLDECRASRSELFPEDLSGWTVESATRQGALSTQDIYDVVVTSPNGLTVYTFEIGLTYVEGIMYVNYWDYSVETIDPSTLSVDLVDAIALFQQFLSDYADDGIDSTAFCATYDQANILSGCAGRDTDLANNLVLTYGELTKEGLDYKGDVSWIDDTGSGNAIIMVDIYYDTSGVLTLQLQDMQFERVYTDADYLAFATALFNDFFYSTRSPEDICNEYFTTEQYDFCMEGYTDKELEGYTQEVVALTPYEDHYKLTINMLVDDIVEGTMDIEVYFTVGDSGLQIIIDPDSGETDEYYDFIADLLEDYQDNTISSEVVCNTYFLADDLSGCISERDQFIASGTSIELIQVFYNDVEEEWQFEAEFNDGTNVDTDFQTIVFVYDDNDDLKVLWEDGGNTDNYELYRQFVVDFVNDYQDRTVDSNTVCNMYFGPVESSDCIDDRDEFLAGTTTIQFLDFYMDEEGQWTFEVRFIEDDDEMDQLVLVDFYYDENNNLKLHMMDDNQTGEIDFIVALIEDYQDNTISSDIVCNTYFYAEDLSGCIKERDEFIISGMSINLLEVYFNEMNGVWEFTAEFNDGTTIETDVQQVIFVYDESGELKVLWDDDENPDDYQLYFEFLLEFITDYQDKTIDSSTVCQTYLGGDDIADCIEDRDQFLADGITATLEEFYPVDDDVYGFILEVVDGTMMETIEQHVMFIYDENNNLSIVMLDDKPDEFQMYYDFLHAYFADYGDSNLDSEWVCNHYLDVQGDQDCIIDRDEFIAANGTVSLVEFYRNEYGMWMFVADFYDGTTTEQITQPVEFMWTPQGELKFRTVDIDPNMELYKQLVVDMITDFQDSSIPTVEVCTTYFMTDDIDGCAEERDTNYDFSYAITLDGFWPHGDGTFGIELIYSNTTEEYRERMIVEFHDDNGIWKLSLQPDPMMFFENYIHQFFNDMQDTDISNEDFCNFYFEGEEATTCIEGRNEGLGTFTFAIQQFYPMMDGVWFLEYEVLIEGSPEPIQIIQYILFYEDEFGNIKIHNVVDQTNYDDAVEFFQSFLYQYNDETISSSELCNLFFTGDEVPTCIEKRDNLEPGYIVQLQDMQPLADGRFKVFLRFYQDNVTDPMEYVEEWIVTIYQDEQGNWKLSMEDGYYPGDEFNDYVTNFVMSFNDSDLSLETVCNIFYSPEAVQECLNMFQGYEGYTMDLIEFYPIDMGDYMIRLRLDNGTDMMEIDYSVYFYHDEFGTLWMHPAMHNPGVDFDTAQAYLDHFVVVFNDSSMSNTDFAALLDGNSQWLVPDFRQMALDNGLTITYYWLYLNEGTFQFEFELSDGSMHLFDVMFHDNYGELVAELWYPAPLISEDDVWTWINSLFNAVNTGVDTDTICATYFGPLSQRRCTTEINQWRTNNQVVVPTALSGYDKWDLTLTFTYEDGYTDSHSWGLAFFWDENGEIWAEFLSVLGPSNPITWNDAEGFIGGVIQAINRGDQIPTICMNMFAAESYDECYQIMEMIIQSGSTIQAVHTYDMTTYWQFDLELLNASGEIEVITLHTELFYYQIDFIKAELIVPGDGISEAMKLELLYDFLFDFNDGNMTISMLCQTYFDANSTQECETLFQTVNASMTGDTLDYWYVDVRNQPHYIEFAIREDGMTAREFVSFDVSFIETGDGSLQFSVSNAFYYTYGDETLAFSSMQDLVGDFNDSTMTTEQFCNLWSSLFDSCDSIRNDAIANNEILNLIGVYSRDHHSFSAHLQMDDENGLRFYDIFIEFRLVVDGDGYLNIWGWSERIDVPKYDDTTVQNAFETFINDFFDDTISDQDFMFQYDYVWVPGMGYRQDMMERGLTVTVQNTYVIYSSFDYQEFEAEIIVTEGSDQTTYYLRFTLMEDWDNQLIPAIFYPDIHLTIDHYEPFINTFLSDIQNPSLTNEDLCDPYFGPWEDWLCGALRNLILNEGQTLTLEEIIVDESGNKFVVAFSNGMEVTLGVDANLDILGNRYMTVFYHIPIELWDQADQEFYAMISAWETAQISLSDLCLEIDCSDILNDAKSVESIYVEEHHFHPDKWMQYAFYAELRIYFTDGTYQYVELRGAVERDLNGEYVFTYRVIGEELAIPFEQTQLFDQDVVNVLNLFITDMLDDTIDAQTLCNTYFGTQMRSLDCVANRQMYIDNNYTITLLPLVDGVDEIGNTLDIATFQFDDATTSVDMSIGVRVYDYGDGTYYIWFIDNATQIPAS